MDLIQLEESGISPGGSRRSAANDRSSASLSIVNRPQRVELQSRYGSTLMVVLVILALVGLLTLQSAQSMILIRQTDERAQRIMQTQELIELGQLWLRQRTDLTLESLPQPKKIDVATRQGSGSIAFEVLTQEGEQPASQVRLVAKFPVEAANPTTATWISPVGYLNKNAPADQSAETTDSPN